MLRLSEFGYFVQISSNFRHDNEVHRQIQLWGSEIALNVQGLFILAWVFVSSSGLMEVIVMHSSCSAKFFEETVSSGNFS